MAAIGLKGYAVSAASLQAMDGEQGAIVPDTFLDQAMAKNRFARPMFTISRRMKRHSHNAQR
jgi:hypothetical protein